MRHIDENPEAITFAHERLAGRAQTFVLRTSRRDVADLVLPIVNELEMDETERAIARKARDIALEKIRAFGSDNDTRRVLVLDSIERAEAIDLDERLCFVLGAHTLERRIEAHRQLTGRGLPHLEDAAAGIADHRTIRNDIPRDHEHAIA